MSQDHNHLNHATWECKYHVAFTPKYRKKLLFGQIRRTWSTGTEASGPIKAGAPVIDYATGTTGAFAISAALYQRQRTERGQYIDLAMMDVALILQASHVADHLHSGYNPKRSGNKMRFAESSLYETKDGLVQLAASNRRQHRRFYNAIGESSEAERISLGERYARVDEKQSIIADKIKERTADEWETYLQTKHVPAARVRELGGALKDPELAHRGLLHRHDRVAGAETPVTVPVAAF